MFFLTASAPLHAIGMIIWNLFHSSKNPKNFYCDFKIILIACCDFKRPEKALCVSFLTAMAQLRAIGVIMLNVLNCSMNQTQSIVASASSRTHFLRLVQ